MDPLSALAGVVGLTDAASRTGSKIFTLINTWRNAPRELHSIREDVSVANEFLRNLGAITQVIIKEGNININVNESLERCLISTQSILTDLEKNLDYVSSSGDPVKNEVVGEEKSKSDNSAEIRKSRWLRRRTAIISLQAQLKRSFAMILERLLSNNV